MLWRIVLFLLVMVGQAQAETFYISPTGSDANDGLTTSTPWLTFTYALDVSRASCGDTLILRNGEYGDGTSTGKITVSGRICTEGDELIIQAENQRQAKILDNGTGRAVYILDSAYITLDGLYARSTDNSGATSGTPFFTIRNNHVTLKNLVARNPNRYANVHVFAIEDSTDVLIENSEGYVFHRHCVEMWRSTRVTARQVYCNPRGGRIAGGYNAGAGLNGADAAVSMYPCRDCIQENVIADGTTSRMYLNEMNATYGLSTLMSGSQVLGSICYKCNYANGVFLDSRTVADANHTPQNITVRDVALIDWASASAGVRVSDGINITLDHITVLSTGSTGNGIMTDDKAGVGTTAASNSVAISNILVAGLTPGRGFHITGFNTWTGDEVISNGNGTAFNPPTPSNWTNTSTAAHLMGTCKVWVPVGALGKGAGTGGSDIGATVLYRTINGVLTTTPLWDPTTGEFPHGADDVDGTNNVAGDSLKDFHTRINVNAGGCSFPAGYGTAGPANPSTHVTSPGTTSTTHDHTIDAGMDRIVVCSALYHAGANVGSVSAMSSGGEALTLIKRQVSSPAYRAVEMWQRATPTSGTRSIAVTTTGNVDGIVTTSIEMEPSTVVNDSVSSTALGTAPSTTVTTSSTETIIDCLAMSSTPTASTGANQTYQTEEEHGTQAVRLSTSEQDGADGGVMSWALGSNNYYAHVAASFNTVTVATNTRTLTKYRVECLRGTESGACIPFGTDATGAIATTGSARIRAEISGGTSTSLAVGMHWYCRAGADAFTRAMDTYGGTVFKHTGNANDPDMPGSNTATTQQLSAGNFVAGRVTRDEAAVIQIPELTSTQKTEMVGYFDFNGAAGDVMQCRPQLDSGLPLDAYTVTPTINLLAPSASTGF